MNIYILTKTDILVICFLLLFVINGWRKGFFRSLMAPLIFFAFCIIGVIHFDLTNNIVHSFSIILMGTVVFYSLFRYIYNIGRKSVKKDFRDSSFFISRLLGSVLNTAWNGSVLLVLITVLTFSPVSKLDRIKKDILNSHSYNYAFVYIINQFSITRHIFLTLNILRSSNFSKEVTDSREYKAFSENPKIKALKANKEIMKGIDNNNLVGLIFNNQIRDIYLDNDLMQNITMLTKKIYLEQADKN